ncbi:MAG: hypothetical protein JWQ49_5722 [Edaphobacter sp.]|nr:hypothetical protein [Edaphobacter sp.]
MQTLEPSATPAESATQLLLDTGKVKIESHADDPRWQLAWRIATSGTLGRSRLLARFLLFTVDRYIGGRSDEITEQQIGILVFDRAEGYDSNEDNIIRSHARKIRRPIDDYYASEGKNEAMYLEIPRGGYVPAFTSRDFAEEAPGGNTPFGSTDDAVPNHALPIPSELFEFDRDPRSAEESIVVSLTSLRRYGKLLALCLGVSIGLSFIVTRFPRLLKPGTSSPQEAASRSFLAADLRGGSRYICRAFG